MVTGSKDTCIKKWSFNYKDLLSKDCINLSTSFTCKAHSKDINGLAVSKNYAYLATASQDKTAKVR